MKRAMLMAIAIALISSAAASAGGRNVFRQRTVQRGGGSVRVQAFAVQPFFVQPVQPVFVQPTAIFAAPTGFSTFSVQAFGGCCGCR